jgi:hypothetical protein
MPLSAIAFGWSLFGRDLIGNPASTARIALNEDFECD